MHGFFHGEHSLLGGGFPEEQASVVQAVGASVADACATHGYHSMDLVVLHPATPGLEAALQRFDQPHTHADDEVRYILEGEGIFGFLDAQGEERVVCVRAGDYLRVPAGESQRGCTGHRHAPHLAPSVASLA